VTEGPGVDSTFALTAVFGFLAVVLCLEGAWNLWASKRGPEARRIAQRLAAVQGTHAEEAEPGLERVRRSARLPALEQLVRSFDAGRRLSRWVQASGLAVSAGDVAILSLVMGFAGTVLPTLMGRPPLFGLAIGLALGALPWWRVASRRARRVARFEHQFPEALDLMARAMRAGHAFATAVRMVGEEMGDPLGRDFRMLSDEMNYGASAQQALARLADRVPLPDVSYFVVAVMIQRESGGNLAELLDKISTLVRERLKLMGEVRTLSAEGRLSAIILTCLPFGVGAVVNFTNPEFLSLLWTDRLGERMVGASLFLMVLGILWMRRIIRIRV